MGAAPEPPGRLDVPLVWSDESQGQRTGSGVAPSPGAAGTSRGVRLWELWIAYLADTGVILLAVGTAWVLAALGGAGLNPLQIVLAAIVGVEIASLVITAAIWVWRGSPGMLLANLAFAKPVALSDALALCLCWHLALPLLGLPLLLRRRGLTVAERIASAPVSFRPARGDA